MKKTNRNLSQKSNLLKIVFLIVLSLVGGQAQAINFKFWEYFKKSETTPETPLKHLKTLDRKEWNEKINSAETHVLKLGGTVDGMNKAVGKMKLQGAEILSTIRAILEYTEHTIHNDSDLFSNYTDQSSSTDAPKAHKQAHLEAMVKQAASHKNELSQESHKSWSSRMAGHFSNVFMDLYNVFNKYFPDPQDKKNQDDKAKYESSTNPIIKAIFNALKEEIAEEDENIKEREATGVSEPEEESGISEEKADKLGSNLLKKLEALGGIQALLKAAHLRRIGNSPASAHLASSGIEKEMEAYNDFFDDIEKADAPMTKLKKNAMDIRPAGTRVKSVLKNIPPAMED